MKDIQHILDYYKVKSYKETNDGLVAIHKRSLGLWLYFRWNGMFYMQSGSTESFVK